MSGATSGLAYTLKRPIEIRTKDPHSGEIKVEVVRAAGAVIELREPEANDLRVFDKFGGQMIDATIKMIAALSDLDEDEAGRLKAVDLTGLGELVADFVPDGLPTGATA